MRWGGWISEQFAIIAEGACPSLALGFLRFETDILFSCINAWAADAGMPGASWLSQIVARHTRFGSVACLLLV